MRMILHRVADDVSNLIEPAIILLVQGMQDSTLNRLQSVFQLRNRPISNDIGSVLEEIIIDQILQRILR